MKLGRGSEDEEKTLVKCKSCGNEKETPKPGIVGPARLRCRQCGGQTTHEVQ